MDSPNGHTIHLYWTDMNNVLFNRMLYIFEEFYKSYSNFGKAGRLGLLYDKTITFYQRGRRRKKERVWKRMRLSHIFFTPARDTRHMPRLHAKMASIVRKPFTSFAKIPTRDPEILPCYWCVAANTSVCALYLYWYRFTHTRKNYPVSCTHTFPKLCLHLYSPPQMFYINWGRKWKVCLYLHQGSYLCLYRHRYAEKAEWITFSFIINVLPKI